MPPAGNQEEARYRARKGILLMLKLCRRADIKGYEELSRLRALSVPTTTT